MNREHTQFDKIIVLRTKNPKEAADALELVVDEFIAFVEEKHGNGPTHYSLNIDNIILIEIYPERS